MVDPLRGDIKRLMEVYPNFVIEYDDMKEILDGRVENIIKKHKDEDKVFSKYEPRKDMEDDGKIDNLEHYTKEMAEQRIRAFEQNYDEQSVKNIEDLRKKKSKKSKKYVKEYDEEKKIVDQLRERFNL